jgi:hypothetical protein
MICQLHKIKHLIWITLLLAFSIVYVTDILCDLEVVNIYTTFNQQSHLHEHGKDSHDHPSKTNLKHQISDEEHLGVPLAVPGRAIEDDHQKHTHKHGPANHEDMHSTGKVPSGKEHDHEVDHEHHDGHQKKHNHDSADDDCCTTETNAILNTLICHDIPTINTIGHFFTLYKIEQPVLLVVGLLKGDNSLQLYYDLPPPRPGFLIRIIIQSFLN